MLADRIIALLALVGLGGYLAILGGSVPRITLVIVLVVVFLMAVYDFWRDLKPGRKSPEA